MGEFGPYQVVLRDQVLVLHAIITFGRLREPYRFQGLYLVAMYKANVLFAILYCSGHCSVVLTIARVSLSSYHPKERKLK